MEPNKGEEYTGRGLETSSWSSRRLPDRELKVQIRVLDPWEIFNRQKQHTGECGGQRVVLFLLDDRIVR